MFKHNQMVIFFNNKKEDICDEKTQISSPKRNEKGSFLQFLPQRKVTLPSVFRDREVGHFDPFALHRVFVVRRYRCRCLSFRQHTVCQLDTSCILREDFFVQADSYISTQSPQTHPQRIAQLSYRILPHISMRIVKSLSILLGE